MKISHILYLMPALLIVCLPACNKLEAEIQATRHHSQLEVRDQHIGPSDSESAMAVAEHAEAEHDAAEHSQDEHAGSGHHEHRHKIIVTSPIAKDVVTTEEYVCQIHSCKHIEIRALQEGYLVDVLVNEGQAVEEGKKLFQIQPILYQARLDTDKAEAQLVQIEYDNSLKLFKQNIVSQQELNLTKAKLSKAQAKVELAQAEKNFTDVKAPFSGIVNRQVEQLGSLIEEGDKLTTLSDNSVMWVYFNVPEARYIEYKTTDEKKLEIELKLAGGTIFSEFGKIGAIEADFNNETGNIAFRADFPNPDSLLRHGQTGTVLLHHVVKNAIVLPQRATYEILAKKYAYAIDEDNIVHQREIVIANELDDIYLIKDGLKAGEKVVLEGIRQVRDGDHVEYEFEAPEEVLGNLKNHAE